MARVDGDDVKEIIDTDLTANQITPFITAASAYLDVALDADDQTILGEDLLTEIERWVAAAMVAVRDPRVKSETTLDARVDYAIGNNSGEGWKSNPYGQIACAMDLTGKLGISGKQQAASIKSIDLGL